MSRGPAIYGVKWERNTPNGYNVRVVRDAEMEDMLRTDIDIKRAIYQVIVSDGDDVKELHHEFNLSEAVERAKALVKKYGRSGDTAEGRANMEDYL